MKKWLIAILLICPIFIKAECNYNKHTEFSNFANYITYETEYSKSDAKFTITFYNVIKGLSFKIGKNTFEPTENDTIVLTDIEEGRILDIYVYGTDGCSSQVGNLNVTLPYYNPYYGTEICKGYENLTLCASNFTATKATKQMIEKTKESYDNVIIQESNETTEEPSAIKEIGSKVWDFFVKYVSKVLLIIGSGVLSVIYYDNKLSKVEHGI